jgi:hypothetical protein
VAFIQIIEFRTDDITGFERLGREWEAAAAPDTTARRRILVRDRKVPDRYMNIVFFDSYEEAMQNSSNPVTQRFAEQLAALADGPPGFEDLDVIEDVEL